MKEVWGPLEFYHRFGMTMVQLKICFLLQSKRFLEKPRDPTTHSFWLLVSAFEQAKHQLSTQKPGEYDLAVLSALK